MATLDIENPPKVPHDSCADAQESEETNHLATEGARKRCTGRQKPEPPSRREFAGGSASTLQLVWHVPVALLVELDVSEQGQGHEENQSRVEKDKTSLSDVGVVLCVNPNFRQLQVINIPKSTKQALKAAIITGYPDSRMMAKTTGMVKDPSTAL